MAISTLDKDWTRRSGNHNNAKEMEIDWPYLEEGESKPH